MARTLVVDEAAVNAGVDALRGGAVVVCDVEMVRAGITTSGVEVRCLLAECEGVAGGYPTRSAQAMRLAARRYGDGAVVVVGCAPSALAEVVALVLEGWRPALVIGLPVGFVGASDSKAALVDAAKRTGLAVISNTGERGGSSAACAAVNALLRIAAGEDGLG